jgi:glycosyltransferase involved in cell wall biosynthesis
LILAMAAAAPPTGRGRPLSVLVAAFNAERTIESTLRSVLAQTRLPHEIVVVDDGSTDRTSLVVQAVARREPTVRLVQQENRGLAAARNAGIEAAEGELVSILDADDLWMPDYVSTMLELLDARPDAGIAYGDAWAFEDSTKRVRRTSVEAPFRPPDPSPPDAPAFLRELLERNFVYGSTTLPRHILVELGGFDESLRASEDWEMWLRIAAAGYRGTSTRHRIALYRRQPAQMSMDLPRMHAARREVYRRVAETHPVPPEISARARALGAQLEAFTPPAQAPWKRHPLAAPLRRAVNWARHERDYHRIPPAPVRAAFPDLADR